MGLALGLNSQDTAARGETDDWPAMSTMQKKNEEKNVRRFETDDWPVVPTTKKKEKRKRETGEKM